MHINLKYTLDEVAKPLLWQIIGIHILRMNSKYPNQAIVNGILRSSQLKLQDR